MQNAAARPSRRPLDLAAYKILLRPVSRKWKKAPETRLGAGGEKLGPRFCPRSKPANGPCELLFGCSYLEGRVGQTKRKLPILRRTELLLQKKALAADPRLDQLTCN